MKIICVGRNYADHAIELNNPIPEEPVIFMKPDSALLLNNRPFFLPDFSKDIQYETELVIKIDRLGKHIEKRFAHRYYNEITVGIDFTARDLQNSIKTKGKPWEIAKGFDGSAVLGSFIPFKKVPDKEDIQFSLNKNGKVVQSGHSKDMIFHFDEIIEYVSRFFTLKMGDIIFTGTPAGVGKVEINDRLEAYLEDQKLLDFFIR